MGRETVRTCSREDRRSDSVQTGKPRREARFMESATASGFLRDFDGVRSHAIFCMWTGTNPMSEQRLGCLASVVQNTHCPVVFINHAGLRDYERPESPFHPAFDYLSEVHKSDYLRCYLMHHYGGGYTDIKTTVNRWDDCFERLHESGLYGLGYT